MNTDRLVEFQTLAQTLHYGRAAEKLYISQSVLSRHIQDLEKELGAKLFQRGPHEVTLTPAGAYLHRESINFLSEIDRAAERVSSAGIGLAGSVRFACLRATYCDPIQDFLEYFEKTYPNILLTPELITDSAISADTANLHYLALPSAAQVPYHFQLVKTFYEKAALVLPSLNGRFPDGVMSLSELEGETLFLPGHASLIGSYARIRQLVEHATGGRVRVVRVRNPETALMNVDMGRGFTILPQHRVTELRHKSPHMAIAEADCYFEILFYRNEAVTDDPAALLFGKEFCDTLQMQPLF